MESVKRQSQLAHVLTRLSQLAHRFTRHRLSRHRLRLLVSLDDDECWRGSVS